MKIQTLTANITEIANRVGRDGFEQIEASRLIPKIKKRLEGNDKSSPLNRRLQQALTFNLKNLSEGLQIANEFSS